MTSKTNACVRGVLGEVTDLTDNEIDEVIQALDAKRNVRSRAGLPDTAEAVIADAEASAADLELAAAIERRNANLNRITYRKARNFISRFGGDDVAGLEALIGLTNKRVEGARVQNVETLTDRFAGEYLGGLVAELRAADVLNFFTPRLLDPSNNILGRGPLDKQLAVEMWELRDGGNPGSTGSPEARKAAPIFKKYQDLAIAHQNERGAFIRPLDGYIVAQDHDQFRINAAGAPQWVKDIRGLLDPRTFENVKGLKGDGSRADEVRITEYLEGVWKGLSSGYHLKAASAEPLTGFKGPSNLAKQVSQERVLHFKDAEAWLAYDEKYGSGNVVEAAVAGLSHAARNSALLEVFGTNPRAMFDRIRTDLIDEAPRQGRKVDDRLKDKAFTSRMFDVATGEAAIPTNVSLARMSSTARALESMIALGGAVLSSFSDMVTAARVLQFQGRNLFGGIADQFVNLLAQIGDDGLRRHVAELVGIGADSKLRDMSSRFSLSDPTSRRIGKSVSAYFKLNLVSGWTTGNERALSTILSRDMAMMKGKTFATLPAQMRMVLGLYEIGPREWNDIRKHAVTALQGTEYIDAAGLRSIADPERAASLETKLRAYFADRTHSGVIRPGIRETTALQMGSARPGQVAGELARLTMQFNAFPAAYAHRVLGAFTQEDRFLKIPGSFYRMPKSDVAQFASFIVAMWGIGYLSMVAKDIAKGREPRDPTDPRTWGAAMLQSGGLGVYADVLFSQDLMQGGQEFTGKLAGPVIGDVAEAASLLVRGGAYPFGDGDPALDNDAWRFGKDNLPFVNLFYTKAALDYLIFYQIQESISPGSLARMEQRLEDEKGQKFILPPSGFVE